MAEYTAVSRKVVGKTARDNPAKGIVSIVGGFQLTVLHRMVREIMDVRLRMLKESNKSRLDSYSVRNSVLIISHITFRDCRVHIFFDSLSRNSCIIKALYLRVNVFSTKVLIEDANRDGTTILHGHPCHAKVSPFSG